MKLNINMIVAIDKNNGIGKDNKLLTYLPDDLAYFKEKTLNNIVIMGRKTLNSLSNSKPLKNRETLVLSRTLNDVEGAKVFNNLKDLLNYLKTADKEIFVCGGQEIYNLFLPYSNKLYITYMNEDFSADTFFPEFKDEFNLISKSETMKQNGVEFSFLVYERIKNDK